ncbi:MAG: hypothetical protein ABIS38_01675, partial [Sphingomicrobium sp.]
MKLARLNVSHWPLPDLVAFNNRVHGRVDPWWARKWVRRIVWAGLGGFCRHLGIMSSYYTLAVIAPTVRRQRADSEGRRITGQLLRA